MTDFGLFVVTWMKLDTAANWATIIVAVVAIGYAINNYALRWFYLTKGWLSNSWPLELTVGNPQMRVASIALGIPAEFELKFDLDVSPFPMAWHPRRPIKIDSIHAHLLDCQSEVQRNVELMEVIDRRMGRQKLRCKFEISEYDVETKIKMLKSSKMTLKILTSQAPRSNRECSTTFSYEMPIKIGNTDMDEMIEYMRSQ